MVYKCITHEIRLTIEGKRRIFDTLPGSVRGLPPCKILTLHPIAEGKFGDCEIEKVEG